MSLAQIQFNNSSHVLVKVKVSVSQSCPALCSPVDCSLPGSSVHGMLQSRILEWVAFLHLQHCEQILYHLSHHRIILRFLCTYMKTFFEMNIYFFIYKNIRNYSGEVFCLFVCLKVNHCSFQKPAIFNYKPYILFQINKKINMRHLGTLACREKKNLLNFTI